MIKLFNTYTRKLEVFEPQNSPLVTFYGCGPTVYDYAHIGNLRAYIFDDTVRRVLEFNGYQVKEVINITDVGHLVGDAEDGEDKMVKGLKREGLDHSVASMLKLAQIYTDEFMYNFKSLNILTPTVMPRATQHVKEMIEIIEKLIKNGYVYETSKGFYFDTAKYEDYGTLGNLNSDSLKAGARIEVDPEKRNPFDFAVWIKAEGANAHHVMLWDAPFSSVKGFPGWHIECSAMSMKYLGQTIDIHAGGIDHIQVHHTNENAQSVCSTGKQFVKYWMHNEFLVIRTANTESAETEGSGEASKMSKSAGTFIRLQDLIEKGYDPLAYRYLLLQAHYRSPIVFSYESLDSASSGLNNLRDKFLALGNEEDGNANREYANGISDPRYMEGFKDVINVDFDTPKGLAMVFAVLKDKALTDSVKKATVLAMDAVLGLNLSALKQQTIEVPPEVIDLAEQRVAAKKIKDFKLADELRERIGILGYEVMDNKDGYDVRRRESQIRESKNENL